MSETPGTRVAVIAIHGVGDHLPCEMARAAGDLLASRAGGYDAFQETTVRIEVSGVVLNPQHEVRETGKRAWGPFDRLRLSGVKVDKAEDAQKDSIDHLFMEAQLRNFQSQRSEDVYECLRLDGHRQAAGAPERLVHIYDMFWSNLSGVSQSGARVFGELYQLLFHLGSVGVTNAGAAATYLRQLDSAVGRAWGRFAEWQKIAAAMLAFPIPLINLIVLMCAASIFATAPFASLNASVQALTAAMLPIACGGVLWAVLRYRSGAGSATAYRAPLILTLLAAIAAVIAVLVPSLNQMAELALMREFPGARHDAPEAAQWTVAIAVLAAAWFGGSALVAAYDKRRPGARTAFKIVLAIWLALTVLSCFWRVPWIAHSYAIAAMLRGAEIGFWMLALSWIVFWIAMIIAALTGRAAVGAVRNCKNEKVRAEESRASRTNWTARLTIALPGLLFLLVTFAAWSGLLHAALPLLWRAPSLDPSQFKSPQNKIEYHCRYAGDTICYAPVLDTHGAIHPARTWADESFYSAGVGVLPVLFLLTGLAALIALYAVGPSVLSEVAPPEGADPHRAIALGNWLDFGFSFMRTAGRAMYVAVFLFAPLMFGILILNIGWPELARVYIDRTAPIAEIMGAAIGGTAIGLLAFGGRLSRLALGLRTVVRVGLDVDNWLREHPEGTNPTVRICARYVSLLRHVAQWRDANGRGYDALVIFAHSQGTVITADLLRFLNVEKKEAGGWKNYDPALEGLDRMNVYLFTVGCPLRQLYGLRFPYLYGFADDRAAACDQPDPADLGLKHWLNGYRTGDYIGRFLWRSENPWDPGNHFVSEKPGRAELALGPGAHTHYWDRTGERVADLLDEIIADAEPKPRRPSA